jgi:hypothetical protein
VLLRHRIVDNQFVRYGPEGAVDRAAPQYALNQPRGQQLGVCYGGDVRRP